MTKLLGRASTVVASGIAGLVGAFLVWSHIYSIGSRVVSDDTYYRLHDLVVWSGCLAGVLAGLLTVAVPLRKSQIGVLFFEHALAVLAGIVFAPAGWKAALSTYFGAIVVFSTTVTLNSIGRRSESFGDNKESSTPISTGEEDNVEAS